MDLLNPPKEAIGKYQVLLCDPPWNFDTRSSKGQGKSPSQHYNTMTIDDICALPIGQLAAPDCALFLWGVWPRIFDLDKVIRSWGFAYSGLAWEWLKWNPNTEKFAFGTGYGTRKNVEPCVLARRGAPKVKYRSIRDFMLMPEIVAAPRREHSRKPDEQYAIIERLYDGPYLEIFARQQWPGWDAAGNQIDKFAVDGVEI